LRGAALDAYGRGEIVEILDMSGFVATQRENCVHERLKDLILPFERPYRPMREDIAQRIGLDPAL